jgi:hypothetical protein
MKKASAAIAVLALKEGYTDAGHTGHTGHTGRTPGERPAAVPSRPVAMSNK